MRIRMKQLLSFLYFLALSLSGYGGINYSYDASGNRVTLRKEIIIRQITPEKEETSLQDPVRLPAVSSPLVRIQAVVEKNRITIHVLNTEDFKNASAVLCSVDGIQTMKIAITSAVTGMDVSALRNGIYILSVTTGGSVSRWKIILR